MIAAEKTILSKMLEHSSNRRVHALDRHSGMTMSGRLADGRAMVYRAREEAQSYKNNYGVPIPSHVLAQRIAAFTHVYTLYGHVRPFGVGALLATYDDKKGPALHLVEPSGMCTGYHAIATGKGRAAAKTELEKLKLRDISAKQAVKEAARIIHMQHDEVKDKPFILEMGWISATDTKGEFKLVPQAMIDEAETLAKAALAEMD